MYCRLLSLLIVLCSTFNLSLSQVNPADYRGEPDEAKRALTISPVTALPAAPDVIQQTSATTGLQMRVPGSNINLITVCLGGSFGQNNDELVPGFYRLEAKSDGAATLLAADSELSRIYTGFATGSRYYALLTPEQDGSVTQLCYDTSDFSFLERKEIDASAAPAVTFVNPHTGKVYAFLNNSKTGQPSLFSAYYPELGCSTPICELAKYVNAAAFFNEKEFYAICDRNGILMRGNAETGAMTEIGCSYVYPGKYNSLIYEPATGKLLWLVQTSTNVNALYELNPETAVATKIREYSDSTVFTGAYAMPFSLPAGAPAKVSGINIRMTQPSSLYGTVSLTAPVSCVSGEPLTSNIAVAIMLNDRLTEIHNICPGQRITSGTLTFQQGLNNMVIMAYQNNIRGEELSLTPWAGTDIPATPENVTLSSDNGKPVLSWSIPETGAHGGFADVGNITYRIVRQPSGTVFNIEDAYRWTDITYSEPYAVWYNIYALNSAGSSTPCVSNRLSFSNPFSVPFDEDFSTEEDFRLWSGYAVNGSPFWTYSSARRTAILNHTHEVAADAWLISPAIELKEGQTYTLSFRTHAISDNHPEEFSIYLGTGAVPEKMSTFLGSYSHYTSTENGTHTIQFIPEYSGVSHVGIHCTSGIEGWGLTLEHLSVRAHEAQAPEATPEATLKPVEPETLLMEFVVPYVTIAGHPINGTVTAVIISEDNAGTPMELPGLTPGSRIEHRIDVSGSGFRTYRIYFRTGHGDSPATTLSAYCGFDVPAAVSELSATASDNGTVSVSWKSPKTGVHGGYCAPEDTRFTVIRSDGKTIASNISDLTAQDTLENTQKQTVYYYIVIPGNEAGNGPLSITEPAQYGESLPAPYNEGFSLSGSDTEGWYAPESATGATWVYMTAGSNPPVADFDGNMGLLAYRPTRNNDASKASVHSPYLNLSQLQKPVLNFYIYEDTQNGLPDLTITASTDNIRELPLEIKIPQETESGWRRVCADLKPVSGQDRVRLTFSARGKCDIYIDLLSVDEFKDRGVSVTGIVAPPYMGINTEADVRITLTNLGDVTSSDTVLKLNSQLTAPTSCLIPALAPGRSLTLTVPVKVISTGDDALTATAANSSLHREIHTGPRRLGTPVNLTATQQSTGTLMLTWDAPLDGHVTCDTFESYPDWAIDNIGPYLTFDRDHSPTYFINKDLEWYPHSTDAKAFQVCNAELLGIDAWTEGKPHVGSKMLMCLSATDRVNDDWLILPQLNERHRDISVYIKSFTDISIAPERLRIMVSSTDADPESFTPLMGNPYIQVPSEWVRIAFTAPAGTRYVAFNCVSDQSFALFIDRLEFTDHASDPVTPTGYMIYKNGEPLATTSETHLTLTQQETDRDIVYTVAAIGPEHMSLPSEPVTIRLSSLNDIKLSGIEITPDATGVTISGAKSQIKIFTPDGISVYSCIPENEKVHVSLNTGVYIVSADSLTKKIIIQ
ncbi:MAG: choice-of-anchor J domain-containing protein [Muribaculaceae bacterium]|nr:choice-of-anchor J domain-containing protein [Muribaculaceae bacterium]